MIDLSAYQGIIFDMDGTLIDSVSYTTLTLPTNSSGGTSERAVALQKTQKAST